MPPHKRTVHPGQSTPHPSSMAEPAGISPADALFGWTDLEPREVDALVETVTSSDQWAFDDTSDTMKDLDDVDDAEDQL